ncbi:XRE family transcriptional regulator [Desulforamulus profundi]|uniref:XRE family transcriptional regulator n=1 Tax=Desulforamulus profundi TaxID=1383067 RepID=A0A2C6L3L3_9FIRM|nr:cupin domain-containing protein [Desulforamulus profundi]PHJ39221.1 XRE family transcriptional regulator [Desulforamulus profundi]
MPVNHEQNLLYISLGFKIRELRKEKQKTLQELAREAGISAGLLSQVERGTVQPSLDTLWKITKALNIPLFYLLEQVENKSVVVVKQENQKKLETPNSNVVYRFLSPDLNRKIEFMMITLKPGHNHGELLSHAGEECGVVIQGTIAVRIGEELYILNQGDSIYFDSNIPHRFYNPGNEEAVGIWAMTPPTF